MAVKRGPLGHTERTQIGIYVHGYARIVLDVEAAVDAIVAAARSLVQQTQHMIDGIKVIALALVVAAFAHRDVMDVVLKSEATWKISHLISLQPERHILGEFIVRISLG